MTPTYYGIFAYSPNNSNPSLYKEGDFEYQYCLDRIKDATEFQEIRMERYKTEPPTENRDKWIAEIEREYEHKVMSLKVKPENRVFYIADEEFNILFETNKVFKKGHWTKEVHKAMKKFGLNFDNSRIRTDGTIEQLKRNVEVHNRLAEIAAKRNEK